METLDKDFTNTDLVITTQSKNYLLYAAKWAGFLSIIGFISLGLMILGGLFIGIAGGSSQFGIIGFIYLGMAVIYFFPIYYLYLFAQKIKKAVNSTSQSDLEGGFENLKSCFKFLGIFTIVIISVYILIFLVAFVAGSAFR
jgi:uncharacterized membrane protein